MDKPLLKEQAQKIFTAVEAIERSLHKDLNNTDPDLTLPQLRTLMVVARNEYCTMSELGRLTGYAASALTGIIDRMIKKRLVVRVGDDNDRRIVKVAATRKGIGLAQEHYRKIVKHISAILEKASLSERAKIVNLIEKIAGSFGDRR